MTSQPTVVWTEIPVTDLEKGAAFYSAVFGLKMVHREGVPNDTMDFSDDLQIVSGHLYPGKPASGEGPTIHLRVPDGLETSMARCEAEGGKIVSPPIPLPVGRFAYATDPDGNSIGLFEPAA